VALFVERGHEDSDRWAQVRVAGGPALGQKTSEQGQLKREKEIGVEQQPQRYAKHKCHRRLTVEDVERTEQSTDEAECLRLRSARIARGRSRCSPSGLTEGGGPGEEYGEPKVSAPAPLTYNGSPGEEWGRAGCFGLGDAVPEPLPGAAAPGPRGRFFMVNG